MSSEKKNVYIETYSEKSFVVRGDTRPYRESLKAMGGKWVNRLTDKTTREHFGAWIFWTQKRSELEKWVESGCKKIESIDLTSISTEKLTSVYQRLSVLESKVQKLMEKLGNDDETPVKPRKRLLKRN